MAGTWLSPEAKAVRKFVQELLVDRNGLLASYMPIFVVDWKTVDSLNIGGGAKKASVGLVLQNWFGQFVLSLEVLKEGKVWRVSEVTINRKKEPKMASYRLLHGNVSKFAEAIEPTEFEWVLAEKCLDTPEKRTRALKAILTVGSNMVDGTFFDRLEKIDPRHALYMAEHQSQSMSDYWGFCLMFLVKVEEDSTFHKDAAWLTMVILASIAYHRPHYLVENWRSLLVGVTKEVQQ